MFNLLIRFLLDFTHSSVLLCSATQPPLDNLKEKAMCLPIAKSILNKKYNIFQRTEIINKVDIQKGTSYNEVAQQALDLVKAEGNCLVIVNTKASVTKLYELLKNAGTKIYCLTTNLCAEHRLKIINEIKEKLKIKEEIICISTNLIEAGVDIDFASEIRFLAGLDNVIQSAGRCNREGKLVDKDGNKKLGKVYLIFNTEEKRDWVQGLKESQQFLIDLMHDEDVDFFSEKVINDFYFNKFFLNSFQLYYSVKNVEIPETNQIDLLGDNIKFFSNSKNKDKIYPLRSSFDTSSKNFKVIDNDQIGIIVPYGKQGKEIIDKIRMGHFEFIKKAQRYTVNLYINKFKSLSTAIEDLGHGILALKEGFYDEHLGVVAEFVNQNSIY